MPMRKFSITKVISVITSKTLKKYNILVDYIMLVMTGHVFNLMLGRLKKVGL